MNERNGALDRGASALGALVLAVLAILVLPLPGFLVDGLLALSVSVSVLILLLSVRIRRPLDLSVFPALLLLTTLFRLALNVATTRLILLKGGAGAEGVGHLIKAFGEFAVGGSVLVGAVVFLILLVVNFMVITKGSGRISEVAARFTLDALPGKQMSIDADLAAGAITDREAQERRALLGQEAEFFGAMDGASKFVRGDAVAGLVITAINLVGGLLAGALRDGMDLSRAVSTYTVLTVGDGLLSQLPALLISTAAGIVVTKAGDRRGLSTLLAAQVIASADALGLLAAVLVVAALLPGMPTLALLTLAAGALLLSRRARQKERAPGAPAEKKAAVEAAAPRMEDVLSLEGIEVELGLGLVALIDPARAAELPGRVTVLRQHIAGELGVVLPEVHLKDSLALDANTYRVLLRGMEVARGRAWADRMMVIDPMGREPDVAGVSSTEPTFGLPVRWVTSSERDEAERRGFSLVDSASVVITHLGEVLRRHAHELVGRAEVQLLLDVCARSAPKLVEDTVPTVVTLGELTQVVRHLLLERVSVRDLKTVLEAVADAAAQSKDVVFLTDRVRVRLARFLTSKVAPGGVARVVMMAPDVEATLRKRLGQIDGSVMLAPELEVAQAILDGLDRLGAQLAAEGRPAVVLCAPDLRRPFYVFASRFVQELWVVSARELVPGTRIEPIGSLQVPARLSAA